LNYSVGNPGSAQYLAAELFKIMTGTDIVRIPYKGGNTVLNALLTGEVQLTFAASGAITPLLKSGKVRALAVTSAKPSPLFPGLPALADSGLPGYEAMTYFSLFAPAKTPAAIIDRLNAEVVRVLGRPEVKDRLFSVGITAVGSTPIELAATVKNDLNKWGKVIKDAGIHAD
jgi:tripartite-type tricarboxylate transporter receptor subunit TctC